MIPTTKVGRDFYKKEGFFFSLKGVIYHEIGGQRCRKLVLISQNKLEITELPVAVRTDLYKESVLEPMLGGGSNKKGEKAKKTPLITLVF